MRLTSSRSTRAPQNTSTLPPGCHCHRNCGQYHTQRTCPCCLNTRLSSWKLKRSRGCTYRRTVVPSLQHTRCLHYSRPSSMCWCCQHTRLTSSRSMRTQLSMNTPLPGRHCHRNCSRLRKQHMYSCCPRTRSSSWMSKRSRNYMSRWPAAPPLLRIHSPRCSRPPSTWKTS